MVFPDLSRPSMTMNAPRGDIVATRVEIVGVCIRVTTIVAKSRTHLNEDQSGNAQYIFEPRFFNS